MQQTTAEFAGPAADAAIRPEGTAPRAGQVDAVAAPVLLLLDRGRLLSECLARALPAEWPDLVKVTALGPDELRRERHPPGAFDICVLLLGPPPADLAPVLAEDLGLVAERLPGVPVAVVGDAGNPSLVALAARRGARGFFSTGAPLRLLAQGIRFILLGGTALPAAGLAETAPTPEVALSAARPSCAPEEPSGARRGMPWSELDLLTPREAEVVRALAAGRPNKLIAHELGVCETTVKVHLRHVFRKLGCTNRTQAALLAREVLDEADDPAATAPVGGAVAAV